MRLKIAKRYGGKNRTQRLLRCAVAGVTSYAPPGLCFLRRGDHRFSYTHGCKRVSKNARAIRYGDLQTLLADRRCPAKDYIFPTRSVERIDCGCQVVLNKVGAAGQHASLNSISALPSIRSASWRYRTTASTNYFATPAPTMRGSTRQ